jgi:PAS domain S-box-containing protein
VVISITSARSPERGLRLLKRGADACVSEPFEPEYLIELCRQARRQRALIRVEELFLQRTRALRSSESRFRALFEGIPETVFVRAENGVILHVNDVGARRWGIPAAELVGTNLENLLKLPPGVELVWNRPGSAGPPPRAFEATMVSHSGRRIEVDVNERRIDFEGRPAVLSVARDVTAKRELERQRADFLAMLTHDIRNPLGVILGYTGMLEELGDLRPEQREILSRIVTNSQSVLSLVNNYLDLAKIEAGRVSLVKQAVALNELLRRVAERYEIEARRKSIDLELDFDSEIPRIPGDPLALERVFTNLLHNALKFTPGRGRVRIASARHDGTVSAVVSDTGPGIAPRELATIFEKYRRSTSASPHEGTGLGLFIARALVEAHGGRIEVDTSADTGSRFEVFLPYL